MTPPDTNLKKQRRRHWPVIWGIVGAFVLAFLGWIALSEVTEDVNQGLPAGETISPSNGGTEATGDTN